MTRTRISALVITISVAVVIALFWTGVFVAHLAGAEPGTTPDWIAAIGTLAAFGAALVAGWFAYGALVLEQDRDHLRELQATRAQAELTTGWVESVHYGLAQQNLAKLPANMQVTSVIVHLRNGSMQPISNVSLQVLHYVLDRENPELLCDMTRPFLKPNSVVAEGFTGAMIAPLAPAPDQAAGTVLNLTFTDASGRRWSREGYGEVRPVVD